MFKRSELTWGQLGGILRGLGWFQGVSISSGLSGTRWGRAEPG